MEGSKHTKHPPDWFLKRVGKDIYRHEETGNPTKIPVRAESQAKFLCLMQDLEDKRYFDDGEELN